MTALNPRPGTILEGVCHYYMEIESGNSPWAFQDARFIQKNVPRGYCEKCGVYIRHRSEVLKTRTELVREARRIFWRNFWLNFKKIGRMIWSAEKAADDDDKYVYNICPVDGHTENIGDAWGYAGNYLLKEGDQLTIYGNEQRTIIVFAGKIRLREHSKYSGAWQEGVAPEIWGDWFLNQYPATLIVE